MLTNKKRGRHFNFCRSLRRIMSQLDQSPHASRVILGEAHGCKHTRRPGYVEIVSNARGGLQLRAYDERGKREIYVCTSEADRIVAMIESHNNSLL